MHSINYNNCNNTNNIFEHIEKAIIDYVAIYYSLASTDDYKITLSAIYHHYAEDIVKYKNITGINTSHFLWINNIKNNKVPINIINLFCNLIFKVLLVKHSSEKIEKEVLDVFHNNMKLVYC